MDQNHHRSPCCHHVSVVDNSLAISRAIPLPNNTFTSTNGAHFLGSDKGEFGGSLKISLGSVVSTYNIAPIHMLPIKQSLYLFSGGAHLGTVTGSVFVIKDSNKPEKPTLLTLLPDMPIASLFDGSNESYWRLVILGTRSISIMSPLSEYSVYDDSPFLELFAWKPWPEEFIPNSIVKLHGYYFIGGNYGIVAINENPGKDGIKIYYKPIGP